MHARRGRGVEGAAERLGERGAHAAGAHGEAGGADDHAGADELGRRELAVTRPVGEQQQRLERRLGVRCDPDVLHRADARREAVDRPVALQQPFEHRA